MTTPLRRTGRGGALALAASLLLAAPAVAQHDVARARTTVADDAAHGPITVHWNALARPLVGGHGGTGMATRPLALLSVAQQVASLEAKAPQAREVAVAAASAGVLAYLYPAEASHFRDALRAQRTAAARAGMDAAVAASADSIGRAVAARVIARAKADRSDAAWRGTVPTGTGLWTSAAGAAPVGASWAGIRPWVLTAPEQFRPAAPPAVGTRAFAADLAEVQQAVRHRTPAQLASARKWAEAPMAGYWNEVATELIARGGLAEPKAAEVLAALNVALMDANIACFDAKYAYWSIRPSQADTTLDVPVMLPNFPAYPSGHACLSAAAAEVLGAFFPAQRDTLDATAQEVADSRLYAGVHYRLDNDVGMEIGRKVARLAMVAVTQGTLELAP
ncbi:MAG TPA: vanadium-dependent haloperoxidase [Gemmatimonadaceae bacterium]|nr:vanadium-dependent haloperoxidase [Gemmatimonadaceae bacterium]